jgi:nicotinate-nucleotide adenylyltransferase
MVDSSSTPYPKIGFFGGTFDPIHNGHLSLAKQAIVQANLETLLLCPAYHAPLRSAKPFFQAEDRLGMLEKLADEHPKLKVFPYEISQQKVCFTYHTLLEVGKKYSQCEIILLLGTDQFHKLPQWKFIDELAKIVTFLVCSRTSDMALPEPPLPEIRFERMNNELIDLSSTTIRQKIQSGQSIRNDIPGPAYDYLDDHNLLQPSPAP